jgi:hypothetical protein
MDLLNRIVTEMDPEDIRYFKVYATRMTGYEGRKDLQLFDNVRQKKENYDEQKAMHKISGNNRNAFYRLKNRLINDLNDFIALHHFDAGDMHALNRDWVLFHVYLSKQQLDLAYFFLKKAEKKALVLENFEMLDIIYSHLIRLSNEILLVNPEDYIALQKENAHRLNLLRQMDHALAALTYRVRVTQNWAREDVSLTNLLEKTSKEFTSDAQFTKSQLFQTRAYRAVSQLFLQRHQYAQLLEFVSQSYHTFQQKKWFNKDNHELKLQMLTYLVNAAFEVENYNLSLKYGEIQGAELDAFGGILREKFLFFYYNSLALNYMKLDPAKALKIFEQTEAEMKRRKISYYDQFIYLNKAIVLHWLGKPDAGIRTLVKLYVLDSFKQTDASFRFRIMVAEQIMQFDAGDKKSFILRLNQLKDDFKDLLAGEDFVIERELLSILAEMISSENYFHDKAIISKAKKFLRAPDKRDKEQAGIINYNEWLSGKFNLKK